MMQDKNGEQATVEEFHPTTITEALDGVENALNSTFLYQCAKGFPGLINDEQFTMELTLLKRLQRS